MKRKKKKKGTYWDYWSSANWSFYKNEKLFGAFNVHGSDCRFESTTKSGLIRKINNYLK